MPAVTVIMPVYNSAKYLKEAIDSILNQSFTDFEFFIFNDGSKDNSAEIIETYKDPRIRFFNSIENKGYIVWLNEGVDQASGKYIARMDADDVSQSHRFQEQFDYMESHPETVLCGSRFTVIGEQKPAQLPLDDETIRLSMLYITPFCHPSVFIRTGVLKENKLRYEPEHIPAEDHELWVKLSQYGKFHNIENSLLHYRIHDNNISMKKRTEQQVQNLKNVQLSYISVFFKEFKLNERDVFALHDLFFKDTDWTIQQLQQIRALLQKIISEQKKYPVDTNRVELLLEERFYYRCTTSTNLGLGVYRLAAQNSVFKMTEQGRVKLLVKSLFKFKPGL